VIVSGAETDVCVLSTALDAVNIGFRVVIVEDALCSSSDKGHDALMTMYRLRFGEQIDLVTAGGKSDGRSGSTRNQSTMPCCSATNQRKRRESAMAEKDLNELFLDTFKEIYYAEKHTLKALPKMAKAPIRSIHRIVWPDGGNPDPPLTQGKTVHEAKSGCIRDTPLDHHFTISTDLALTRSSARCLAAR